MTKIEKISTHISDLFIIKPKVFGDDRGFFFESYNKSDFEKEGINYAFVQDNHSKSVKGVLRGLHFQTSFPQTKLVRVLRVKVFDVDVDIRKDSDTFGKHFSIELSAKNKLMLLIPPGFAHGFLSLTDEVEIFYKVDQYYHPQSDNGIIWNDSDISVNWPLEEIEVTNPILSSKDSKLQSFGAYLDKCQN